MTPTVMDLCNRNGSYNLTYNDMQLTSGGSFANSDNIINCCCITNIMGCMNSNTSNYNPNANTSIALVLLTLIWYWYYFTGVTFSIRL